MYPLVFGGVSSYALLFPVMCAVPITFCIWRLTRVEGQSLRAVLFGFTAILFTGALGAKLFSLGVRNWQLAASWSGELESGWRWSGLIIGLAISVPLCKKYFMPDLSLRRLADTLGIALALGMSFGRVVCFIAGCCVGAPGNGFLYLSFAPGSTVWYHQLHSGVITSEHWSEPVLALQILFFIVSASVAVFLYRFDSRRRYDGQVLLLFLALHESSKAVLELLRDPLIPEQLIATIAAGLIGVLGLLYCHWFPPQNNSRLNQASRSVITTPRLLS